MAEAGWTWTPRTARYRDAASGKFVPNRTVVQWRNEFLDRRMTAVRDLATALQQGWVSVDSWQEQMAEIQRETFGVLAALGRGGLGQMTDADWRRVNNTLARQQPYLQQFSDDVWNGRLTAAQITARAQVYVGAAVQAFEEARAAAWGMPDLPAYPGDGSSECLGNDRCSWRIVNTPTTWECTWDGTDDDRTCDTCLERQDKWAPLIIPKPRAAPEPTSAAPPEPADVRPTIPGSAGLTTAAPAPSALARPAPEPVSMPEGAPALDQLQKREVLDPLTYQTDQLPAWLLPDGTLRRVNAETHAEDAAQLLGLHLKPIEAYTAEQSTFRSILYDNGIVRVGQGRVGPDLELMFSGNPTEAQWKAAADLMKLKSELTGERGRVYVDSMEPDTMRAHPVWGHSVAEVRQLLADELKTASAPAPPPPKRPVDMSDQHFQRLLSVHADRVAGLSLSEIATKHNTSRGAISRDLKAYAEMVHSPPAKPADMAQDRYDRLVAVHADRYVLELSLTQLADKYHTSRGAISRDLNDYEAMLTPATPKLPFQPEPGRQFLLSDFPEAEAIRQQLRAEVSRRERQAFDLEQQITVKADAIQATYAKWLKITDNGLVNLQTPDAQALWKSVGDGNDEIIRMRRRVDTIRAHIGDGLREKYLYAEDPAAPNWRIQGAAATPDRGVGWQKGFDAAMRLIGWGSVEAKPLEAYYRTSTTNSMGGTVPITRSFYTDGSNTLTLNTSDPGTFVHELGHWLEDNVPEVHRAAVDFLMARTDEVGEKPRLLVDIQPGRGFDPWEQSSPDQFSDPYMGKFYGDPNGYRGRRNTEIVSMLMQRLYEDPHGLAGNYPVEFDWIVSLLHSLRKPKPSNVEATREFMRQRGREPAETTARAGQGAPTRAPETVAAGPPPNRRGWQASELFDPNAPPAKQEGAARVGATVRVTNPESAWHGQTLIVVQVLPDGTVTLVPEDAPHSRVGVPTDWTELVTPPPEGLPTPPVQRGGAVGEPDPEWLFDPEGTGNIRPGWRAQFKPAGVAT